MFYDVLMEKRAEREEEKKQPPFLRRNAGNLAAIPVAAGGLAGAQYLLKQPDRVRAKALDELKRQNQAANDTIKQLHTAYDELADRGPEGFHDLVKQRKITEAARVRDEHHSYLLKEIRRINAMEEDARRAYTSGTERINKQAKEMRGSVRPKALVAGGLGLLGAYGVKKLVDRYALRNQQRD
jgi:hypothetical protein